MNWRNGGKWRENEKEREKEGWIWYVVARLTNRGPVTVGSERGGPGEPGGGSKDGGGKDGAGKDGAGKDGAGEDGGGRGAGDLRMRLRWSKSWKI